MTYPEFAYTKKQLAWLHDLETTDAEQASECLEYVDTHGVHAFCCLGRACVVLGAKPIAERQYWGKSYFVCYEGQTEILSERLREELGLTPHGHKRCWEMNDEEGLTFKEIANEIKTDPEFYFGSADKSK